ncbi:MAG: AAA family ATPase, partial [Epsilonproteobacteria bacterium]|nr:AAA family ATPase [Campylobacterota bacterium]
YDRYQFNILTFEAQKRKDAFIDRFQTKTTDRPDFLNLEVGTSLDGREKRYFRLGDESEAYHAFITGRSGTGKTTLINNIITAIATNYTPDEIKLYLMDYKLGTEFGIYDNHPNCEKIYLDNENIQAAITMLEEFIAIRNEREVLFKQAKANDIESYNMANASHRIPHCILIIDEVHMLFSGEFDYKQQSKFNALLSIVAKQGRSFGMHLILTTQSLDGVNIEKSTMNQISLRISYKLQDHMEAMKIFNENNTKEVLSLEKFVFIYNTKSGDKEANQYARAKYHSRDEIVSIIDDVRQKKGYIHKPIVIDKSENEHIKEISDNNVAIHTNVTSEILKKEELINSDFDTSAEKALLEKLKKLREQNGEI